VRTNYSIRFDKAAQKYFNKLDKQTQKRIAYAIDVLSKNPYEIPNSKPLSGISGNVYRLRIGQLRMIYEIKNEHLIIIILRIGPRGDIYK
jgi:mRNA interferase RelE/StbE